VREIRNESLTIEFLHHYNLFRWKSHTITKCLPVYIRNREKYLLINSDLFHRSELHNLQRVFIYIKKYIIAEQIRTKNRDTDLAIGSMTVMAIEHSRRMEQV